MLKNRLKLTIYVKFVKIYRQVQLGLNCPSQQITLPFALHPQTPPCQEQQPRLESSGYTSTVADNLKSIVVIKNMGIKM